jgi:hypothetical protein
LPEVVPGENAPATWDNDFSQVNAYSDLDYIQVEATLGANVALDNKTSLYGSVSVMDFQDDQPYVFGDLDGILLLYSTGMTVGF